MQYLLSYMAVKSKTISSRVGNETCGNQDVVVDNDADNAKGARIHF